MAPETSSFKISKPIAFYNKEIKISFADSFKALSKAAISAQFGNIPGAISSASDALAAVGFKKDDVGTAAWLLIRRALMKASFDLVKESSIGLDAELSDAQIDEINSRLDLSLENVNVEFSRDTFANPGALTIVRQFQVPFKQWLMLQGANEASSQTIVDRFPSYFTYALIDEWRLRFGSGSLRGAMLG